MFDTPDRVDEDLASLSSGTAQEEVLRRHLEPQVGEESHAWIWELGVRAARHALGTSTLRSLTADLAWRAREAGQSYPSDEDWKLADRLPVSGIQRLTLAYAHGQRARFDFKFRTLEHWSETWLREFPDDALILGFAAFAAAGARSKGALDLFSRSADSRNADYRSRSLSLQSIWFANHIPNQPQLLLSLSSTMLAEGAVDANLFYRRAFALRRLHRFDEAMEEIDRAIAMHPVGMNAVHQDYVREREFIVATSNLHSEIDELARGLEARLTEVLEEQATAASEELNRKLQVAQSTVTESLLKVVEILGLFVTLAGFLIASGFIAFGAATFSERLLSLIVITLGSLSFFILLRMVISFRTKQAT